MSNGILLLSAEFDRVHDFRLMRLIEWAGLELKDFDRLFVSPGQRADWSHLPQAPQIVVPMGPVPLASLGLTGAIDKIRGYFTYGPTGTRVLPTVSPGYIAAGNSRWSAAFINDVQKAHRVAREGIPPVVLNYTLDPSPGAAYRWAQDYLAALDRDPTLRLAFDIETPGKGEDEDAADDSSDAPDRTWTIERIGFAYAPYTGLSIPWGGPYLAAIQLLCGAAGDKVVWNAGFDCPRIRRAGVALNGLIHDGMVAWHILHSDLPKRLGFVATFCCPYQPAWKHLSGSRPAFYNCTDADVELRCMESIERELRAADLWEVYDRDVVQLDPILAYMTTKGMPIDPTVRLDRAQRLAERMREIKTKLEALVPLEARRIDHVYTKPPSDVSQLQARPGSRLVRRCPVCGLEGPRKDHFKVFKRKINSCGGAVPREAEEPVTEYYRLAPFTPSRDQLIAYHHHLHRPLPMVYDKKKRARKVSFGELQIKGLQGRYPEDPLYALVLDYRTLDKVAGTYIGRPVEE